MQVSKSWCCLLFFLCSSVLIAAEPVDYMTQIKPLFKTHCVKCHGAATQKGSLRMDTAAAIVAGGDYGSSIDRERPESSLLLQVITGKHDELERMPYKRPPLTADEIELVRNWIKAGAKYPAQETPTDDRHWAFVAPVQPVVPTLQKADANLAPVDIFIRAKLEQEGLRPAPRAEPATLLRRVALDLTGLPPTAEQTAAFLRDPSPAAYAKLVDELLASPNYGERWGRWWLDQARYADSNGYSIDAPRQIWKYRDWVIDSLNRDLPFDQFTIEQLAGDLLPNASQENKVATGFHRNTQINQEGGIDPEQFRIESIVDRVGTTGTVWLGLTVACAQCHDHKFDPLTQREYYQLFAFFNNQNEPNLKVRDPGFDPVQTEKDLKAAEKRMTEYFTAERARTDLWEKDLTAEEKKKLSKEVLKALETPAKKRSFAHWRAIWTTGPGDTDQEYRAMNEKYAELDNKLKNGPTTMVLEELSQPRKTTIMIKGDFTRPGDEVTSNTPRFLPKLDASGKLTRLELARWIVSRDNPLTARVMVNRVWQQYFGRGIVETDNDFGTMGIAPTHPELLDWLAVEFMKQGWSLKQLHRQIVTSATYQQSSSLDVKQREHQRDPKNYLLWRQTRLRLDGEIVRDVALHASGLLVNKLGGPPVYPPIPDGLFAFGQVKRTWTVSKGDDRYRRGIYTFVYRATPPPSLSVFDTPEGFSTCTRRLRSNTPLQALTLLNDASYVEFAQALAKIIDKQGIRVAFQRCVAREATPAELKILEPLDSLTAARALLNLDETITRE
jgi:mono/diheme cytochrome c family protein